VHVILPQYQYSNNLTIKQLNKYTMKNYDQIQAQLADLSDMIAQVHQQDLQAHRDKLKQQAVAEQTEKETILTRTVARATGMIEAIIIGLHPQRELHGSLRTIR